MKALILRRPGSILDMRVQELSDPEPQACEVRIRLKAASLNPLDYKLALSGHPSWKYPHIPGTDGVGTIEALGTDVESWKIGQRVCFHTDLRNRGCFSDCVCVPHHILVPLPDSLSDLDAATLPCAALAAWHGLINRSRLQSGQTILVQGAAGGVGGFALQIARRIGLRTIASCSPNNNEYVRSLGAMETIDYSEENVRERIMDFTDDMGVNAVIDIIGGHSATVALTYLGFGGHLICFSGMPDCTKLVAGAIAPSIHEIALGAAYVYGRIPDQMSLAADLNTLVGMLSRGELKNTRSKVIGLSEIPTALEELRDRHVRGKIVADLSEV